MRYELLDQINEGSYGRVYKALSEDGRTVAIKQLNQVFGSFDDASKQNDIKNLLVLPVHPHCVNLLDHYFEKDKLHLVFEFFDHTLLSLMQEQQLKPLMVRNLSFMLLQGVAHLHSFRLMHRDIKPENILINRITSSILRLQVADLGLSKQFTLVPHTDYVSTRWYRAPEQIAGQNDYDQKVDVFAAGCVMAEMCTGQALFQGNSQIDQFTKMMEILGLPKHKLRINEKLKVKTDGYKLLTQKQVAENLAVATNCDARLAELLSKMLAWDPSERPTVIQALQSPYFK